MRIGLEHISKVVHLVIDDNRQIVRDLASAPLGQILWNWKWPNYHQDWEEPDGSLHPKQTAGLSCFLTRFVRRDRETPSLHYELRINRPEKTRPIFGREVFSVHFTPECVTKVEHKAAESCLEGSEFSKREADVFRQSSHKSSRTNRHFRDLGCVHIMIPTPGEFSRKESLRDSRVCLEAELTLMFLKWEMDVDQKAYQLLEHFVTSKSGRRVDSSEVLAHLLKSPHFLPQTTHTFIRYIRRIARSITSEEVRHITGPVGGAPMVAGLDSTR